MTFDIRPLLLEWLQATSPGLDAVEVTDYRDDTIPSGYCETCYYETIAAVITYRDKKGSFKEYEHYGTFAELVQELS